MRTSLRCKRINQLKNYGAKGCQQNWYNQYLKKKKIATVLC